MKKSNDSRKVFFALLKAGLWERNAPLAAYKGIDFKEVFRLAEEQSVVGLVSAGIDHAEGLDIPREVALNFAGSSLLLEQRNSAMNHFIANAVRSMRQENIYTFLVKGQGVAQCYERPLLRECGDVDFVLNEQNYPRAISFFKKRSISAETEYNYYKHIAFVVDTWAVELHGTLRCGLWGKIDRVLDDIQNCVFEGGAVRSWICNGTEVSLPRQDEDIVYIFTHILQHFFNNGVGLKQICDWCRLIWIYKDSYDLNLLKNRINKMGVMSEWKAFASLAVAALGMPEDAMPFYSPSIIWKKKAERILSFILKTGSFGHNRDYSYFSKYPFFIRKIISLWRHTYDGASYFLIFPCDTIVVWCRMFINGVFAIVCNENIGDNNNGK